MPQACSKAQQAGSVRHNNRWEETGTVMHKGGKAIQKIQAWLNSTEVLQACCCNAGRRNEHHRKAHTTREDGSNAKIASRRVRMA